MFSHVCVFVAAVLLLEMLCASVVFFVIVFSPAFDTTELGNAERIARTYAQLASHQVGTASSLNPAITFAPDTSTTLAPMQGYTSNLDITDSVPYLTSPYVGSQPAPFALLIAPDGSILASSDPREYRLHLPAATFFSSRDALVAQTLKGDEEKWIVGTATGRVGQASVPVFNLRRQVVGAIYVQIPPEVSTSSFLTNFAGAFLLPAIIILLIAIPVGAVLSLILTRALLSRMQRLVDATTQFASGHYQRRVRVTREDEFGLLEQQFNLMGEQLVESIEQRRVLTEQNARLAERARIIRDLHDGVKQQAFALTMQINTALTLLDTQSEAARTHLHNSAALAYQVQQELTMLIQSSRPSVLSEKGLATALREYITTWSQQQQLPVQQHLDVCSLPPLIEESLLRITQEALSNIARHSHASSVTLDLSTRQDSVTLILEDNGCGFDPHDPALTLKNGVGLQSMRERIEALDGTLEIKSKYGAGTRIVAYCPYPHWKGCYGEAQFTAPLLSSTEVIR